MGCPISPSVEKAGARGIITVFYFLNYYISGVLWDWLDWRYGAGLDWSLVLGCRWFAFASWSNVSMTDECLKSYGTHFQTANSLCWFKLCNNSKHLFCKIKHQGRFNENLRKPH